jgi:hypothetical protein
MYIESPLSFPTPHLPQALAPSLSLCAIYTCVKFQDAGVGEETPSWQCGPEMREDPASLGPQLLWPKATLRLERDSLQW